MLKDFQNIIKLFKFFFSSYLFYPKCNHYTIDDCHFAQHEKLLKPHQVLLGSI